MEPVLTNYVCTVVTLTSLTVMDCSVVNTIVLCSVLSLGDRLVGLVVKASASRAGDPGFESHLSRDFSRSSHTSDLEIGTPTATLPGAWRYRVSAGTGQPGVSIL